jgi:hypothetical protein
MTSGVGMSVGKRSLTAGTHVSAAEIGQGIPIRSVLGWAVGRNWSWAGLVPPASFFFSLFSFPFSIF